MVRQIRTEVELDSLLRRAGNSLSVLYFSSPRCGPCRYMTPYFEELCAEHCDVQFLKVDVTDSEDDFVAKFNVTGLPAFYYFRNGEEVDCFAGGNKDYLLQSLTRNKLRG
ncbi:thioredoxin-like isoform X2 [Rhinatrema bivittatum]|uniref:thioredoxin-like isoform X2 n=1 Tax=Rhinatrema bivittatum TaxID=194408 RepID=UPI00112DEB50|nr:thioredoxin-like isoform X2 [Rhinatrema bivittatum]